MIVMYINTMIVVCILYNYYDWNVCNYSTIIVVCITIQYYDWNVYIYCTMIECVYCINAIIAMYTLYSV